MSVLLDSCFLFSNFISLYSFSDFRRPTSPFAGTRRTRLAAERNWLGPTLSPLDLFLRKDPDAITLFSPSSSPVLPLVLPDQPPNPIVHKLFHSLTANPIRLTGNPTVPQHESRANILLPSLFDSQAHSDNYHWER